MIRRDGDALLKCAAGTSIVAVVPHAVALPHGVTLSLAWVTGAGVLITALIGIVVASTKLVAEATRLVEELEKLRTRIRRFRRRWRPRP